MKKLPLHVVVLIAVLLFAFNNKPLPYPNSYTRIFSSTSDSLNPTLYPLFIENSGTNSQFQTLLRFEKRGFFTNRFKKIVFQYFYQGGTKGFSMTSYVGARTKQDFDSTIIFSSYLTPSNVRKYPEINSNVHLGDVELINQKKSIKILRRLGKDTINKYFVMYPILETLIKNGNTETFINYKLYFVSDTALIRNIDPESKIALLNVTSTSVSGNPSPPHGGN